MGVYVKGMEMPTTCGKCKIKNAIECNRWKLVRSVALDRHRDCPLVPVPPHGRPRWIPVTERLPQGGDDSGAVCENVCLMMDDGTVSCGWMNGITKKVYYLNARDDFIIKAPITRVTHWIPLPKPPEEE